MGTLHSHPLQRLIRHIIESLQPLHSLLLSLPQTTTISLNHPPNNITKRFWMRLWLSGYGRLIQK
ncbi:MAG: hypothetical protein AAFX51_11465, partial [Cyanobacteria bacterium J06636_28]